MHFRGQSHVDAISNTVWGWHKWWLVAWAGHVAGMVGVHGETMQPKAQIDTTKINTPQIRRTMGWPRWDSTVSRAHCGGRLRIEGGRCFSASGMAVDGSGADMGNSHCWRRKLPQTAVPGARGAGKRQSTQWGPFVRLPGKPESTETE